MNVVIYIYITMNKQTQFSDKLVDSLLQKIRETICWVRYSTYIPLILIFSF